MPRSSQWSTDQGRSLSTRWGPHCPASTCFFPKPWCFVIALSCLVLSTALGQTTRPLQTETSRFKVLAVAESGGHHIAFTKAARPWLIKCGETNGFSVDFVTNMSSVTTALLANYRVVLQLDFPPYGWPAEAMSAFKSYIEEGRGGWVGLHHAALLGDFDGYSMWPWFSDFMGGIRFKNYIPTFVAGTVHVDDKSHPCMKGLPASFVISREEWYTFDRSPRPNVHVLASVDESSYVPDSPIRMGDHPVVWTNQHMAARNLYIFMGHGPDLLDNEAFTTLLRNAILWASGK
jgi:type 1 glutamine amidotransferase